jgi:PhzF family phenazine biosynthesis protein
MSIPCFVVDAFTDRPFAGNPAAVCLPPEPLTAERMQPLAAEFNLSETSFLQPLEAGHWQLRWFTPRVEVNLCGHATLAAAHVLWQECGVNADVLRFHTHSGELQARRDGQRILLDFPAQLPQPLAMDIPWQTLLGCEPKACFQAGEDVLVELADATKVRALTPDLIALARLPLRGLIVTAASTQAPADFLSRFFAPGVGIDEDPVTGSAHCALAPYWAERLGRRQLTGYQASARGGWVDVHWRGDRVELGGTAVTTLRGHCHGA